MALAAARWEDMEVGVVRAVSKKSPPENIWSGLSASCGVPGQTHRGRWLSSSSESLVTRHGHFPGSHCLVAICSCLSETGTCLQEGDGAEERSLVVEERGRRKRESEGRERRREMREGIEREERGRGKRTD